MLKAIFIWIYCMEIHEVVMLLGLLTGLFYVVWEKYGMHRFGKPAVLGLLVLWSAAVVIQTVFSRVPAATADPVWQPFQSYSDALRTGGQPELLRSNWMNAVLFYPAGLLAVAELPGQWKPGAKAAVAVAVFAAFSGAIEWTQYRCGLGLAQTDDIIHNTLGAAVGAAVFLCLPGIAGWLRRCRDEWK